MDTNRKRLRTSIGAGFGGGGVVGGGKVGVWCRKVCTCYLRYSDPGSNHNAPVRTLLAANQSQFLSLKFMAT